MKDIKYLEIVKKSWQITWKNKYLWWFGLFLALGGGINFNFNFPKPENWNKNIAEKETILNNFISQHWEIFLTIVLLVFIIVITLFILSVISKAGLFKTLERIEKKEDATFKEGFKKGKKYFWKLFLIGLILGFFIISIVVLLSLPVIFLFYLKALAFGFLAAFLAVLILIPLVILASFVGKYASFYIVLSDSELKSSLEMGYQLFRKNIFSSIIMSLFFIPINMVLIFSIILALLPIGIIFLVIGIILYFILAKIGVVIAVTLGILAFVAFLIFISSIFQVFYHTTWFLFFREIACVKEEERVEETEREIAKESVPKPEGA